jgi:hypothetical protein
MKHIGRCHGVGVQFARGRLIDLLCADSLLMRADIYTKHFDAKEEWEHAISLINIVDPDKFVEHIEHRRTMCVAANSGGKSDVCVSESDVYGAEMNALARVANSSYVSATGAGVSRDNSKRSDDAS